VYEYGGRQHSVQMPNDPGPTIRLQVTPMGSGSVAPQMAENYSSPAEPGVIMAPPVAQPGQPIAQIVSVPSAVVYPAAYPAYPAYAAYPAYPAYYGSPYFYPPIGISLGFGFSGGHRGHRWR
jgi:hypothetical protein